MVYNKQRLDQAVRVFRTAKAEDRRRAALAAARAPQHEYRFRHQPDATTKQHPTYYEGKEYSTDEDYEPDTKRKRKAESRKGKRKAVDKADGEVATKKAKKNKDVSDLRSKVAFITLSLPSEKATRLLGELAETYGTDARRQGRRTSGSQPWRFSNSDVPDPGTNRIAREKKIRESLHEHLKNDAKTYTERQDEESQQIDNVGGRALRNRKVMLPTIDENKSQRARVKSLDSTGLLTPLTSSTETDRPIRDTLRLDTTTKAPSQKVAIPISPSPSFEDGFSGTCGITTRFAHPIDFKYLPKRGLPPCDFCYDLRFGIAGMEEVVVEVYRLPGSAQYEEMGNGHRAMGTEPTKMCVKCSLERLHISGCKQHELEQIASLSEKKLTTTFMEQAVANAGDLKHSVHPVCSICQHPDGLRPASARCCKKQSTDSLGRPLPEGSLATGCGLFVCRSCEKIIRQDGGLIREAHFDQSGEVWQRGARGRRWRADFEFLLRGSLLHQAWSRCPLIQQE